MDDLRASARGSLEPEANWFDLFSSRYWKVVSVGAALFLLQQFAGINAVVYYSTAVFLLQQFAGINAVVYYSTAVFCSAGIKSNVPASALVGAANIFRTTVASSLMDKQGRKSLLLISFSGMCHGSIFWHGRCNWHGSLSAKLWSLLLKKSCKWQGLVRFKIFGQGRLLGLSDRGLLKPDYLRLWSERNIVAGQQEEQQLLVLSSLGKKMRAHILARLLEIMERKEHCGRSTRGAATSSPIEFGEEDACAHTGH